MLIKFCFFVGECRVRSGELFGELGAWEVGTLGGSNKAKVGIWKWLHRCGLANEVFQLILI